MSTYRAKLKFAAIPELSSTAKLVAEFLEQTRAEFTESWVANETIAKAIGRSVRTVQAALTELKRLAFVLVKKARKTPDGRELNSGHRIFLLWRTGVPLELPLFGAVSCASETQNTAPNSAIPPHPPIEVSEETSNGKFDGSAPTEPPPQDSPSDPTSRNATPAEVKATLDKAERVLGTGTLSGFYARIQAKQAARQYGLRLVDWALDRTAEASAQCRIQTTPKQFFWGLLPKLRAEGFVPPATPIAETPEQREARLEAQYAESRRRREEYQREQEAFIASLQG